MYKMQWIYAFASIVIHQKNHLHGIDCFTLLLVKNCSSLYGVSKNQNFLFQWTLGSGRDPYEVLFGLYHTSLHDLSCPSSNVLITMLLIFHRNIAE